MIDVSAPASGPPRASRRAVAVTGLGVLSAFGRGPAALSAGLAAGTPAFRPVTRFDTARRTVDTAAQSPGEGLDLAAELITAIEAACDQAHSPAPGVAGGPVPVLLALHADRTTARTAATVETALATTRLGDVAVERVYTCACVAASTAVADAAARIALGLDERIVVGAAYLVEPDTFAVFDAGRALARDHTARPFSRGRTGLLLGDAVAALVLEAEQGARDRGAPVLARLTGWGRAGDAYHVCRPAPDGSGLARAIGAALGRAGIEPGEIGYINANATGSTHGDVAESAALGIALGKHAAEIPISSTKSMHGHGLEASALLELIVTILTLRSGTLPVNAGYLGTDESLPATLDLVLAPGRRLEGRHALTLNSAFGGANTALVVSAP